MLNHAETVHARALFTLADVAAGAAVLPVVWDRVDELSFVARGAEVRYLRPARGPIIAAATCDWAVGELDVRGEGRCGGGGDVDRRGGDGGGGDDRALAPAMVLAVELSVGGGCAEVEGEIGGADQGSDVEELGAQGLLGHELVGPFDQHLDDGGGDVVGQGRQADQ